jgi:hypothetical protein
MNGAVDTVAAWLHGQLLSTPHNINAVYVEWNHSYLEPNTPREVILIRMSAFGFEEITKGRFDSSNPRDWCDLGDFVWEGPRDLRLPQTDYLQLDWTEVLKTAAATPEIRKLARDRDLLLLIGYHDDAVYDVS